ATEAASYTHQIVDQPSVFRPVTKASLTMADGAVDILIDRAVRIATAYPYGPVHVDLPVALAAKPQPAPRRYQAATPISSAPLDAPQLREARERLAQAQKPILLAGLGAVAEAAGPEISALAEALGAPLITTYKAKGLAPETAEFCLGGHGLSPLSDKHILPLLAQADLVLSIGYDPIEMRHGWIDPFPPEKHIELTAAPVLHGMHGADISLHGDLKASLRALTEALSPKQSWAQGEPTAVRAELRKIFGDRTEWGPHAAFAAARRASPHNTVATADSGAHRILMSQMWDCPTPKTLLQSSAFCTMGCALPIAIGHKRARPDIPVLAVMGDAGLEMVMGELATLRDLALPVTVLVMVDRSLALIELKQRRSNLPNLGVDFGATDFVALANAMGGVGVSVADAPALESALGESWARTDQFTLIACDIGERPYDGAF
ncbi:MAG: thiamine pyrophosphate-dependent enzyme, partial [Neomegalonema sp.]|nr:thiamine pyrophosphate-dependent enzyme [Neomegalonema sp.]